ncbi:hypothetical protein ACOMHN_007564 [Nucella lapillus]
MADAAPAETTAVNTAAGRLAREDTLQPAAEADHAAKEACGQHEVPEDGPASPTGSEGGSSLRGFGRGTPVNSPSEGQLSGADGSSVGASRRGKGRGRVSKVNQTQPGSPIRTRSRHQSSSVPDKRVDGLSKDWSEIFKRSSPSVATDSAVAAE